MLRLIQVILPKGREHRIPEILRDFQYLDLWEESLQDERISFKILVEGEHAEEIIDELQERLGWLEDFRIVLFVVEASLPSQNQKKMKRRMRKGRKLKEKDLKNSFID